MRTPFLLLAALFLAAAAPTSAQVRFLPYVGYNMSAGADIDESFDSEEIEEASGLLVGLGVEFGFTPGILPLALKLRPSVETTFLPGETIEELGIEIDASQTYLQANLDLIGEFSPPAAPVGIFAGVGAAYGAYSFKAEASSGGMTDSEEVDDSAFGVNFLGGVRVGGGFIQPFVQARYTLITIQPGEDDLDEGEEFDEDAEIHGGLSILAGLSIGL